jgi:hypothetical protein
VVRRITGQGFTIACIGNRLGAGDESGAELCGACAQAQHRGNAGAIHDATGSDDWNIKFPYQKPPRPSQARTLRPSALE